MEGGKMQIPGPRPRNNYFSLSPLKQTNKQTWILHLFGVVQESGF